MGYSAVRSRDDAGETQAYVALIILFYFHLRLLGNGRGISAGAHPVFRVGRMERQSVVWSGDCTNDIFYDILC